MKLYALLYGNSLIFELLYIEREKKICIIRQKYLHRKHEMNIDTDILRLNVAMALIQNNLQHKG
jgi:hypothetical protein